MSDNFTSEQTLEIKDTINSQLKLRGLNIKIVQTIPQILEENTLYFKQVSTTPKLYEIYHTDKDGQMASLNGYKKEEVQEYLNNKLSASDVIDNLTSSDATKPLSAKQGKELNKLFRNNIKGEATQINSPTTYSVGSYPNGLFETWVVRSPITAPNNWGNFAVTQEELDTDFVYYDVDNGVVSKVLSKKLALDILENTVTPDKTTFAKGALLFGKNRFNKTTVTLGKYVNATNGILNDNASYNASDYIQVTGLLTITMTQLVHIAFYNESKVYMSGREFGGDTINVPSGASYCRISIYENMPLSTFQLEEGSVKTEYSDYVEPIESVSISKLKVENINVSDKAISANKTDFAKYTPIFSKNRFDKTSVTAGKYVNAITGGISDNAGYEASDWIFVEDLQGQNITFTQLIHAAFYTQKTTESFISGREYGGDTIQVPLTAEWLRCSVTSGGMKDIFQVEAGDDKTGYTSYNYRDAIVIEDLYIAPVAGSRLVPKILIPKVYYLMEGVQYNFYFNSFIVPPLGKKLDNYYCSTFGYRGKFLEKRFLITSSDNFTQVMKVEDSEDSTQETVQFFNAPVNSGSGSNRKVLIIGDSTINQEVIVDHVSNFFSGDVMDITTVGTRQTTLGNKHEGRSGWTMQNYIENSNISGVANPFSSGGTFNFSNYLSTTSQTMGANDWVFIQLGINDLYGTAVMDGSQDDNTVNTRINAMKARLELIISSIKNHNANIRVGIIQTFAPAISQDATGNLLNSSFYSLEYYLKKGLAKWWEYLLDFYDNQPKRDAKVYLIGSNAVIDRENDFTTANQVIDQYDSTQVKVQIDDVHPANGYKQVGDTYIGAIKYFG